MADGGFFWFDPFGNAPRYETVSGTAGGFISWGGLPGWPFERPEGWASIFFAPVLVRRRSEPHFQLVTAIDPDAPKPDEPVRIEWKRSYVPVPFNEKALNEGG